MPDRLLRVDCALEGVGRRHAGLAARELAEQEPAALALPWPAVLKDPVLAARAHAQAEASRVAVVPEELVGLVGELCERGLPLARFR